MPVGQPAQPPVCSSLAAKMFCRGEGRTHITGKPGHCLCVVPIAPLIGAKEGWWSLGWLGRYGTFHSLFSCHDAPGGLVICVDQGAGDCERRRTVGTRSHGTVTRLRVCCCRQSCQRVDPALDHPRRRASPSLFVFVLAFLGLPPCALRSLNLP